MIKRITDCCRDPEKAISQLDALLNEKMAVEDMDNWEKKIKAKLAGNSNALNFKSSHSRLKLLV